MRKSRLTKEAQIVAILRELVIGGKYLAPSSPNRTQRRSAP